MNDSTDLAFEPVSIPILVSTPWLKEKVNSFIRK